ncbi:hypothetical protein PDIDSM_5746 [Penicillium digitatum]|nr:hypothetical protein PDIDSM_5746 [Penicillium digitatum]
MKPLSFQVVVTATNIVSKALARAAFVETSTQQEPDGRHKDLCKRLDKTFAELDKVDLARIVIKEGQAFKALIGTIKFDFTLEDYSVRFAIPNLYFLVVTVDEILRVKGVQIGKLDYLEEFVA